MRGNVSYDHGTMVRWSPDSKGPYLYDVRTGLGAGGPQKADKRNKIS